MTENELILTHVLKCRRIDLVLNPPKITPEQDQQIQEINRRRANGEPLQYLLGEADFMGITLKVDPRVLIPRPETEVVVETALDKMKAIKNVGEGLYGLDIGTGSGNIPIAILKNDPRWRMFSIDISAEAQEVARENAIKHGVLSGMKLIHANVFEWLSQDNPYRQHFSIVISNPPYIASKDMETLPLDVQCEPKTALNGGETGLTFYQYIINCVHHVLKPGGWLVFEIGETQQKSLGNLLTAQGSFVNIEAVSDNAGRDRVVVAQMKN